MFDRSNVRPIDRSTARFPIPDLLSAPQASRGVKKNLKLILPLTSIAVTLHDF